MIVSKHNVPESFQVRVDLQFASGIQRVLQRVLQGEQRKN